MGGLVGTSTAARRLGVTARQVQRLVDAGVLTSPERGVLDDDSVDAYLATRRGAHRRTWAHDTAWGAVAILSRVKAPWMGQTQRSRLSARLRTMTADELAAALRNRATVTRYAAHPSALPRLRTVVVDTAAGARALGLADAIAATVDGYVAADDVDRLIRTCGLAADVAGSVVLRATTMSHDLVQSLADGTVLAAADLAGSTDTREHTAGIGGLTAALEAHRAP